jgi:hypothetical protein
MIEDIKLLSILIPTLDKREQFCNALLRQLNKQLHNRSIEILLDNGTDTIGTKRNRLLDIAKGKYVCYIDDDDVIADNYIDLIWPGIEGDYDCCSLIGIITTNNKNPKKFIHSIEYNNYFEKLNVLYRPPNHLNVIRADIAKQYKFPEKSFGEDTDWAMQICNAKVLKNEYKINQTLYYYKYISNK